MWTHPKWPGRSLARTTAGDLAAYASALPAVEGNTTFYALPRPEVAQRWASAVPADFRFMFKLPRTITHQRKLRNVDELVSEFFDVLKPCLPNMHPVSVQLPAAFGPDSLDVLDGFLRRAPTAVRYSVEVRNLGFFEDLDVERRLNDLLFERGADRVILDSRALFAGPCSTPEEREAFVNKPRLPVRAVATNDSPVVRFIGQTDVQANPQFWTPWIDTVIRWLDDGRSPIVFLHTPDNADAVDLARAFYDEVQVRYPALDPLPTAPDRQVETLF